MKPAGFLLLLSIGSTAITRAAEPATGILSREISAKIREGLPVFQPPSPAADTAAAEPPQTTDPSVLVLPKITVKESRLPRDAADHLMSRDDFKRKMENLYLDTIEADGPLNYFLNQFTIPILSPSKAERGRILRTHRERDRLGHISEAGRTIAPDAAKNFDRELDNSHTTRPAGGLRK